MGDANRKGMGEGGVATMTFNRNNFITMNGSRLFTVYDVCNIVRDEVKAERERVLDKYLELLVSCRFELDGEIVVKMSAIRNVREELRSEP